MPTGSIQCSSYCFFKLVKVAKIFACVHLYNTVFIHFSLSSSNIPIVFTHHVTFIHNNQTLSPPSSSSSEIFIFFVFLLPSPPTVCFVFFSSSYSYGLERFSFTTLELVTQEADLCSSFTKSFNGSFFLVK